MFLCVSINSYTVTCIIMVITSQTLEFGRATTVLGITMLGKLLTGKTVCWYCFIKQIDSLLNLNSKWKASIADKHHPHRRILKPQLFGSWWIFSPLPSTCCRFVTGSVITAWLVTCNFFNSHPLQWTEGPEMMQFIHGSAIHVWVTNLVHNFPPTNSAPLLYTWHTSRRKGSQFWHNLSYPPYLQRNKLNFGKLWRQCSRAICLRNNLQCFRSIFTGFYAEHISFLRYDTNSNLWHFNNKSLDICACTFHRLKKKVPLFLQLS